MASDRFEGIDYDAEDYEDLEDLEDYEDVEDFEASEYDDDDESFEYDDDDEAAEYDDDDESFEYDDDDEAAEYDDDDEAAEYDDDDEAAEYDDDDESFEYDDDDEAYEAGEAYAAEDMDEASAQAAERSRRARRRAARRRYLARLRARRRRQAAALRRRQLAAARRAKGVRRSINRRLRKIHGPRRVPIRKIGRLRGRGIVTARLPNGRTTKMMFSPPLATRTEVNRLTSRINANDAKTARAVRDQAKTIVKLRAAQSAAVKSLTAQQVKSSKDLTKRIAAGDAKLDRRISKELLGQKAAISKHRAQMIAGLRRQQKRSMWNSILLASSLPLYAAYGERSDPFAKNNLILTGSLAFWLLGDDLIGRFLGGKAKSGKAWMIGADTWSYLAPIGNAATAWFLLDDKQHERFVTRVSDVTVNADGTIDAIAIPVASDYKEDFKALTSKSPAVATIISTSGAASGVTAEVKDGELNFTLIGGAAGDTAKVAWAVDTKESDSSA
ncbi:MAG: hypothetical protein PVG22_05310 [Chromatiales bacterium]|jgi:hypothetical protein